MISPTAPEPAEYRLLLHCAGFSADAEGLPQIQQGFDWRRFVDEARFHGLLPLVLHRLGTSAKALGCPESIWSQVRTECSVIQLRNLRMSAELATLHSLFRASGIEMLALKGPVAAIDGCADLGRRPYCDLDILIQHRDFDAVDRLLVSRGYCPWLKLAPDWMRHYLGTRSEFGYDLNGRINVDIHWHLLPPGYTFSNPGEPRRDVRLVRIAGSDIPSPNLDATLFFYFLHAAKHDWSRLIWLRDIAALMREHPRRWDSIREGFKSPSRLMIQAGLLLCAELPDARVPEDLLSMCRSHAEASVIAAECRNALAGDHGPKSVRPLWPWNTKYFRSMIALSDKIRLVFDTLIAPTPLEWQLLPVSAAWRWLFYAVRPLRLASRHLW